ncbi:MAG: outer membrane protein assembly factor BamC [Burkholderiales bacterium]|nr:MAG: outer membrane protein assembly factor BamC [Burkholderiales bacterium]
MLALAVVLLAGCSISDGFRDATSIEYKSATKGPQLDIPPDLVKPRGDERFTVPERVTSGTTFSEFSRERGAERTAPTAGGPAVLPQPKGARIERQGSQRWLVVDQPPDKVWPVVREFWSDSGFALRVESPETGIMETDWAEKRTVVPDSWVRNQLSRVLNSLYTTGERDKFRTRLETAGKTTEVFVSHRGLIEEFTGAQKDSTVWVPRASDPELEAEFLRRLMLRFGPADGATTQQASAAPTAGATAAAAARARIVETEGGQIVVLQEGFDRAWRQVGLALDRSGFTVEDRDRSKGSFFVRYVDPEQEAQARGVIDRVFGTGPKKDLTGRRYRIVITDAAGGRGGSQVAVLDEEGKAPSADADKRNATRIVSVLHEQLR